MGARVVPTPHLPFSCLSPWDHPFGGWRACSSLTLVPCLSLPWAAVRGESFQLSAASPKSPADERRGVHAWLCCVVALWVPPCLGFLLQITSLISKGEVMATPAQHGISTAALYWVSSADSISSCRPEHGMAAGWWLDNGHTSWDLLNLLVSLPNPHTEGENSRKPSLACDLL